MKHYIGNNKLVLLLTYLLLIVFALVFGNYLKNKNIDQYKNEIFSDKVNKSNLYLQVLIKEKQNTTTTIGLGLANTKQIIDILKYDKKSDINLNEYSLQLRKNTDFKNVWFQVISKEGVSIQRSWTDDKNDKIANVRSDLRKFLKDPEITNSISVGRYDMTFKSTIPVYDPDSGEFVGAIEVITHFNSIAKKLKKDNIDAFFLVDRKYINQIEQPFTKLFVDDYYVANLNADKNILEYLETIEIDEYITSLKTKEYYIDQSLNALVSYFCIKCVVGKDMGHVLLVHSFDSINLNNIQEIKYVFHLYILFFIIIVNLIFYFLYSMSARSSSEKMVNFKIILIMMLLYIVLAVSMYKFIKIKYEQEIDNYKKNIQEQTLLEYKSIVDRNKDIADLIFSNEINNKTIKKLFQQRDRKALYSALKAKYKTLKAKYSVRQIHFHLPDSSSFLRMHKPNKYGDSLKGIRESVDYVNRYLKPYYGFEEGKVYNGFRHVYPLFDENNKHLGSVEVSFNIYAFMDSFLNIFKVKRLNFLVNGDVVNQKIFDDEVSNYIKSPIEGFYFDKLIIDKLEKMEKRIIPNKKSKEQLIVTGKKIREGKIFISHFKNAKEIVVVIPMINKLTNKVVASIHIAKSDKFIQSRLLEFKQFIILFSIILAFVVLFIYREYLSKMKMEIEFDKNQKILDSQRSFIIITDGEDIKATNKSFLKFFGFEDIYAFKEKYDCICERFEYEDGMNYIQQDMDGMSWFEYVLAHQHDENLVKIIDKDGKEHIFYIEFNSANKLNAEDYIITFLDITKVKKIEQQLIQSEKMASLGNMIGNIAHQWRQPLSVISTSASGVKMKNEFNALTSEEINSFMDRIVDNTQYLSQTIDTFRNFIRADSEVTDVNIKHELNEIIVLVSATLQNNFIKLDTNIIIDDTLIKTMKSGILIQVLTNIINNAKDVLLEKNSENPFVKLEAMIENKSIIISIEDNGGGVPEEIGKQIFDPYFTTKHESVGTGLGLYMSHKMVTESMGGKLYFKNTNLGAKFYVEIPLDEK
jgi:signal transduction histidine kinase